MICLVQFRWICIKFCLIDLEINGSKVNLVWFALPLTIVTELKAMPYKSYVALSQFFITSVCRYIILCVMFSCYFSWNKGHGPNQEAANACYKNIGININIIYNINRLPEPNALRILWHGCFQWGGGGPQKMEKNK